MNKRETKSFLIVMALAIVVLPLIGGYFAWGGLPPDFGIFPPQKGVEKPGFNIYFVATIIVLGIGVLCFVFLPQLFGFKFDPSHNCTNLS